MFHTKIKIPPANTQFKFNIISDDTSYAAGNQGQNMHSVILLLMVFLLGLLFLFTRAKYGFCFNDEAFCVTLGQRLYNGDALVAEEWHGCQLFSGIMLPFYAFFRLFSQSNEGILLFLRYSYCILWWMCCVFVALSVADRPLHILLVFFFLLFFSPLDYMTISYTSIGLISALVISCIMYKIPTALFQYSIPTTIVFSLFWAILVLCWPFMFLVYIGVFVVSIIGAIFEKRNSSLFYFRNIFFSFRYSLIIDAMFAILYIVVFVLSRAELTIVFNSIPHILSDPEHQSYGLLHSLRDLLFGVYDQGRVYLTISFLTFLYALFARPCRLRFPLFALNAALYIYSQIVASTTPYHFNVQMLHIIFLGAVAFALLRNRNYKLFFCFYGFSACFAIMSGLASNTGIMVVSMAATVAGCVAIIFIVQLAIEFIEQYRQSKQLRIASVALICCVLCLQISSELYIKLTRQYWDKPLYQLTETIPYGAAKGLKTSPETADKYASYYHSLRYLLDQVDTAEKQFLSCTSAPYLYLDADLDFATFSAWSFGYGEGLNDRILAYQQLNPEKVPDIIYCASEADILPFVDKSYTQYEYNGHYLFTRDE